MKKELFIRRNSLENRINSSERPSENSFSIKNIHIHIPYKYLSAYLPLILENDCNIELFVPASDMDNTPLRELELVKKALNNGTLLTWHAPFMDLSPGAVDEKIRQVTSERIKQAARESLPFNPRLIIVHPGYDDYRFNEQEDKWLKNSLKTWRDILNEYPDTNFAVENVFENKPDTLERLIKEMDSRRFGYCFDAGHFNVFSKIPLKEWLARLGSYIAEVHLHDNDGKWDDHFGLGEGNFDFDTLFNFLEGINKQPIFTLEAHTKEGVLKSIEYLEKRIKNEE
ncbi:MAG: sugar phosphate isomerase/epimerase [Nitrospinae bacterium]|nr:sugar phosphate isomerase/epimerase [Nitrospinota bacterium]MBI3815724.1 sugar phosphate isomerase/epimerase [Nitrospinota bacterium]